MTENMEKIKNIENDLVTLFDEANQLDQTLTQVISAFYKVLTEEKNLKKEFEKAKESRMLLEEELFERMADFKSVKTDDGTFFKKRNRYCSINSEKRSEAYDWLKECGKDFLIEKSVNAISLTAAIKEMKLKRDEIPECITVVEKNRIGVRKV